jgi:uncharacterized membrane protein
MMAATAWVIAILYRREFASRTLRALNADDDSPVLKT